MKAEASESESLAVGSTVLLAIPFAELYGEAKQIHDRLLLLNLAKEYHIRKLNFVEAAWFRDKEKALKADVETASSTLGVSILANAAGHPIPSRRGLSGRTTKLRRRRPATSANQKPYEQT